MSEAKFTKGNLSIIDKNNHHGFYLEDDNGTTVCDFYFMNGSFPSSFDNDEANAHLFKAANKMYKALDDLSNGRGLDQPIEQLLSEARGEK